MRIIATKTLKEYWEKFPDAEQQLWAWYEEVEQAAWSNPNELKQLFGHASVLSEKRVVFNIHGNKYR